MKTYLFVLFILTAAVVFSIIKIKDRSRPVPAPAETDRPALLTQTNDEGSVTVEVTPELSDKTTWKFKVTIDTHSGDLAEDMTQVTTLEDDKGNSYRPIAWDGAPPGGHHREGDISFIAISPKPDSITLRIKTIGGIPERRFRWQLGGE